MLQDKKIQGLAKNYNRIKLQQISIDSSIANLVILEVCYIV